MSAEQRARRLGRRHAADGVPAWDLDGDGESALMTALGHVSPTTERNAPHRWQLLRAYREAYGRAIADYADTCTAETPCPVRAAQGGMSCDH